MRSRVLLTLLAVIIIATTPAPASAVFEFQVIIGLNPNGFNQMLTSSLDTVALDSGEVSCFTTPSDFCVRTRATAGINEVNRLFLRTQAHLKRTNAVAGKSRTAFASASIDVLGLDGYAAMAPAAYFVFKLDGTIVDSKNNAAVTTAAFGTARLFAGNGTFLQCDAVSGCPAPSVKTLKVTNFLPSGDIRLVLRSDVAIGSAADLSGFDAETDADFYDTMELLAIQLLDANDQPIPDVHLTFTDPHGNTIEIPDTPPTTTPTATAATPTPTTTPTPSATVAAPTTAPTSTPLCASPPCEDCENCIDDDGDGLVDRADPDCAPPANGGGVGLAETDAAKALDKCAKAVRKGASKLASIRLAELRGCLKTVTDCVQLKPGSGTCLTSAQAKCAKAKAALPSAEATVTAALTKACGDSVVSASNLASVTGLGFSGETVPCGRRGVVSIGTVTGVAECVRLQQACAAERLLGFSVPRAGELLALGGFQLATDLPCLETFANGGGAGIGDAKQKALRKCDGALEKATAKLASGRTKAVQACSAAVFTCVQTKAADTKCIPKAQLTCNKALGGIAKLETSFADSLAKACGASSVDVTDLRASAGLGMSALDGACTALGAPSLTSIDAISSCLERELSCRVDQMLENEIPRLGELLSIGTSGP